MNGDAIVAEILKREAAIGQALGESVRLAA